MKKLLMLLFAMIAVCAFAAKPFEGPWTSEGMNFYLVHSGGPLKIEVSLKKSPGYQGDPVLKNTPSSLLVVLNPNEKTVTERYWRVAPGEKEKNYTLEYPDAEAGIWQIRSTFSFSSNMSLQFKTTPKLEYGVLFSRSRIQSDDVQHIRNSYFLVPRPVTPLNLRQPTLKDDKKTVQKLHLSVHNRQTDFFDPDGRKLFTADIYEIVGAMPDIFCNANIQLPFGTTEMTREAAGPMAKVRTENREVVAVLAQNSSIILPLRENEIYQLVVDIPSAEIGRRNRSGYLSVDGFPVIFCPTPETARKIGGSVVKASDGRPFAYRFQKEMYEWIKNLRKSDLEIEAVPVAKFKKEWFADPRSPALLPFFAYAEHMFKSQVIDPAELTFGTSPMNLNQLTLLYTLKRPYNPYYGNKALMNRILLYYFRKWLSLSESGAFHDDPEYGAYAGGREWSGWEGMVFTADYITLAMMQGLADRKLLDLWAEAVKFPVYRFWCHRLTCENQSLHWPLKTYAVYLATENLLFKTLANDYLKDIADPELSYSMNTGYYMEAYGLDATYTGISSCMLAFAARFANDDTALLSLKKFYNLMAHTVVREPDGSLAAVNGFGHRTAGTWLNAQYGGGIPLLDDKLEDAAAVSRKAAVYNRKLTEAEFDNLSRAKVPANLTEWCQTAGRNMFRAGIDCWLPVWFKSILPIGETLPNAKLPIEKSDDFTRNFNNELYACRTPSYYTLFYTGNYDWRWRIPRTFTTPLPEGMTEKNGELYTAQSSRPWMNMQGMELFWTPKFGIFVSSHNWSMYSQNIVRADRNGKVVDFAVSYSTRTEIRKNKLEFKQTTKKLALKVNRTAEMKKDSVNVLLEVSMPDKIESVELVEQIPYRLKPDLKFTYFSGKKTTDAPGKEITSIKVTRDNGSAVVIRFGRPVTVRQGMKSSATLNYPKFYIGLLEIVFDEQFRGTQKKRFSYTISGEDR